MDEELIEFGTEEHFDITQEDTIEDVIDVENLEQNTDTEENTVQFVEITDEKTIEIEMNEAIGWVEGDGTHHYGLSGRDDYDQHPIKAITGLRAELDEIERIKTVYSDHINIANYYEWHDASYDTYGYFVSVAPNTSTIKICDGVDIFGVSVDSAGFVGGQNQAVPRNNSYGLVVTSGLAYVRCELDVEVGDYVTANAYGYATKTKSNYGYKVLAKENKNGVEYAVIMLGIQSDVVDSLGADIQNIDKRVEINEQNIISAINVANQAYNKSVEASESSTVSEEAVKEALNAILTAEDNIKEFEKVLESTSNVSAQAKAIAESAVTSATSLKDEAISRANEAWAKADDVAEEAYSLCAKIDKYSVGEYSQAYGLTFEQAQSILKPGMIYAPTRHIENEYHIETYKRSGDSNMLDYERIFTPRYLYQWGYIADIQGYGWITIDKNFNVVSYDSKIETNIAHQSVYFSFTEPAVIIGEDFGYWYTDGDEVEGKTGIYEPHTLYKWETDHWLAVATLKGNASNRMVSEVYQTTNEIMMGVINPRGGIAGFNAKLTDTEAKVGSITTWPSDISNKKYNMTILEEKSDENGAYMTLATVRDVEGSEPKLENIGGAKIILADAEDGGSFIRMDADKIDFTAGDFTIDANHIVLDGGVTFTKEDEIDGTTKINGANIATGSIMANSIDVSGVITAAKTDITALTADYIDAMDIKAESIEVNNQYGTLLYAGNNQVSIGGWTVDEKKIYTNDTNDDGSIKAGTVCVIQKPTANTTWVFAAGGNTHEKYEKCPFRVKKNGELYATKAHIIGEITATSGTIGGCNISDNKLQIANANIESLSVEKLSAGTNNNKVEFTNITASGGIISDWEIGGETTFGGIVDTTQNEKKFKSLYSNASYQIHGSLNTYSTYVHLTSYGINSGYGYGSNAAVSWYSLTSTIAATSDESDARVKNSISALEDNYEILFDNLKPCKYKYNDGTSDRFHTGFIAQEVEDALETAALTTQDFAAIMKLPDPLPNGCEWKLRRDEFVALNTWQIQKAKARITELEERVAQLEALINK